MEFDQVVNGIPLILVVIGSVEVVKKFGVTGKWLTLASFIIGLALGLLYQISLNIPVDFSGWFGAAIFGLALGLFACGVYDAVKSASRPKEIG